MSISVANVTTTTGIVYTSVNSTAVTFMSLCNYSGSNVTVNLHVVPNGDLASNTNIVFAELEITSTDTYQLYAAGEKLILGLGDTIQVDASADNAVTTVVSYTSL
jgi:hypothetical protein